MHRELTCESTMHAPVQWQQAVLQKLEKPIDMQGNPWPLDADGKPIV